MTFPGRIFDRREADPRRALADAVAQHPRSDVNLASLSRLLDRPAGYLGRFVNAGIPTALRPDEHQKLADFFGVDERGLGVRDLWQSRSRD